MNTQIQIFSSPMFGEILTAGTPEQPLFCLADVCRALDISNASDCKSRLDIRGVVTTEVSKPVMAHGVNTGKTKWVTMTFINEPNLYRCVFQSRKKEAQLFQDWVTDEVLPAIRKRGGFMLTKPEETNEEILSRALLIAHDAMQRRDAQIAQQQQQITTQQKEINRQQMELTQKTALVKLQRAELRVAVEKVNYYDTVLCSADTLTTTQVAKSLGTCAKKLNQWLEEQGIIFQQSGQWMLRAPYDSQGLHKSRVKVVTNAEGGVGTKNYTVWTQRGAAFITRLYNKSVH